MSTLSTVCNLKQRTTAGTQIRWALSRTAHHEQTVYWKSISISLFHSQRQTRKILGIGNIKVTCSSEQMYPKLCCRLCQLCRMLVRLSSLQTQFFLISFESTCLARPEFWAGLWSMIRLMTVFQIYSIPPLLLLLFVPYPVSGGCDRSCQNSLAERINVHVLPHSHDDVGWLKTVGGGKAKNTITSWFESSLKVDQYFLGSYRSGWSWETQRAGVKLISLMG